MEFIQLKQAIAAFTNRDMGVFVHGTHDVLTRACNNARLWAERLVDFEYSEIPVSLPNFSVANGGNLSTAVRFGTVDPVRVKKIKKVFLQMANSADNFPIAFKTKNTLNERLQRKFQGIQPTDPHEPTLIDGNPYIAYQQGTKLFIAPADQVKLGGSVITVHADVYHWLDDYATGAETDFLLDFCFDWLMYRSLYELNFYLKEDERVPIARELINEAWESVVRWNNNLISQAVDYDLD